MLKNALYTLHTFYTLWTTEVGKLEARYHASQKEEMETTITKRDLERDDAPDAICYLRTGRMFARGDSCALCHAFWIENSTCETAVGTSVAMRLQ